MVVDEIEPFGWRDWIARCGALLCVAVAILSLGSVQEERAAEVAITTFPACQAGESGESGDCLTVAEGRVTDARGRGSKQRYLFEPVDPRPQGVEASWVRLPDDTAWNMDRAVVVLISGQPVQAYYWDGDPVRFESPAGAVVPIGSAAGSWMRGLWWSVVMLGLAVVAWFYPQNRRHQTSPATRRANGLALIAALSAMATFLAAGAAAQTITFVTTAAALVVLTVLLTWWARRRSARDRLSPTIRDG